MADQVASVSEFDIGSVKTADDLRDSSNITTYGAILLPFEVTKNKPKVDVKTANSLKGKFASALNMNSDSRGKELIKTALKNPMKSMKVLSEYMSDERSMVSTVCSKFSGIAVAQTLISGKVTAREAADYLFMGFAPALGVQGSLMGYSGIMQMKDALMNGSINVGSLISGFKKTLKGATDLSDQIKNKATQTGADVLEFDLTISHNEQYQSETPDRRVQNGTSLQEYVHNMPETFTVQCALQEGKRYSKAEFRAILVHLRERKETISLILGDELFENLILTDFSPNHDCTKSGMDYSLSFKKVNRSDIDTNAEVTIQKIPDEQLSSESTETKTGSLKSSGGSSKVKTPKIDYGNTSADMDKAMKQSYDNAKKYLPKKGEKQSIASKIDGWRQRTFKKGK